MQKQLQILWREYFKNRSILFFICSFRFTGDILKTLDANRYLYDILGVMLYLLE